MIQRKVDGAELLRRVQAEGVTLMCAAPAVLAAALDAATLLRERGSSLAHLAHYKCPTVVEFRDALPRTATGKLQKFKLREPYWANRAQQVS